MRPPPSSTARHRWEEGVQIRRRAVGKGILVQPVPLPEESLARGVVCYMGVQQVPRVPERRPTRGPCACKNMYNQNRARACSLSLSLSLSLLLFASL